MIPKGKHTRARQKAGPNGERAKMHPDYPVWRGMLARCLNPREPNFTKYGGRGIAVCERWMDFWAFIEDMGPRPSRRYSIDRIDNNKGYDPSNCRWATARDQTMNRSITRLIEFGGASKCLTEWAADLGMSVTGLSDRLKAGWCIEKALTTPVNVNKRRRNA